MLCSINEESSKKKIGPDFRINKQFIRSFTKRNKQTNEEKKLLKNVLKWETLAQKVVSIFFASSFIIPRETCDTTN